MTTAEAAVRRPKRRPGRYVLQRVNERVFPDPAALAETIARVTAHQHRSLRRARCSDAGRRALTVVETVDARPLHVDDHGRYWRASVHIDGATTLRHPGSPAIAAQVAAVAAGFLVQLDDLPGPPIADAIPGFRDFRRRQVALDDAVSADAWGRRADCGREIDVLRRHGSLVDELEAACERGLLPRRTVHNDAKTDNVLVDDATGEGLCMVDLDTVAVGTVLFDVGELVRTAATTGAEDDAETPPVLRHRHLEAVFGSYLATAGHVLAANEVALFALAGPLMTYEAALRFLTDHLDGDVYFRTARPGHNLDRARAQLRLLDALVGAREQMAEMVGRAVGHEP